MLKLPYVVLELSKSIIQVYYPHHNWKGFSTISSFTPGFTQSGPYTFVCHLDNVIGAAKVNIKLLTTLFNII